MNIEKLTLLAVLDDILPLLFKPSVRARIAQAWLDLSAAEVGAEYVSAAREAKVLVRRYHHLCLNDSP